MQFENFDRTNIMTPVDVDMFQQLLLESNYDQAKTEYLVTGFRNGFDLCYEGPLEKVRREAPNLKLYMGSQTELWNKIMLEVKVGHYVDPFEDPLLITMCNHR